jgi:triosephosphate isomerase
VNRKLRAALGEGLRPILCCGETLAERQHGETDQIVAAQVTAGLASVTTEQAASITIAYEPVWAIGTGETCASDEANRVIGLIRSTVAAALGEDVAQGMRLQYGGSVKPENAAEIMAQPEIDGALVGGAALKPGDFVAIIQAAAAAARQ